jgi:large subunit ribosomal protein L4
MEAPLFSNSGESKGNVELSATLFGQEISKRVLQEVLIAYQANQRRGTSDTKTRAEVSGGGRKPWRQKGTGNARSGSNRSPLWRKGGIVFGPHQRSYRIDVNEYKRRLALATALNVKAQDKDIVVLESLSDGKGKTSAVHTLLGKAVPIGRVLVIVDKKTDLLLQGMRNLKRVNVQDAREINSFSLMHAQKVLVTKAALEALESRFPKG